MGNSREAIAALERFCGGSGIVGFINEELWEHSSFKIGGPAALFVEPASIAEASAVIKEATRLMLPLLPLGKGSNVLFSDEGYPGTILHLGQRFGEMELLDEHTIRCESGANLSRLCLFAMENGLTGMEPLYGIPGTVGGAVYMNAGAYGGEMKDVLISAEHLDKNGEQGILIGDALQLSYRHSAYSDNEFVITAAIVRLEPGDPEAIKVAMEDFMERRRSKQPLEYPSAGSTFKRPEGDYASALIDRCGLKGLRVGGAMVSEKHAGFLINYDNASCKDVQALIEKVSDEVEKQSGIRLECEVKIL